MVIKSFFACVSLSSCRACPWARLRYVILSELITNSWLSTMCTASCMLTRRWPAKWCNACLVIVLTPLKLSSCVLFILCNGKGHTSQLTRVIHNLKNACVDMRWVVHIFQYLKITSFLYSLHDDILDSIYFSLWSVVSLTRCMTPHISIHLLFHLYQDNLDLNNITEVWCRSLPSTPLVAFYCVVLP